MQTDTRSALRLLGHAAAPERRGLIASLAWLILAALLEVVGPVLSKRYIDSYLLPRHSDFAAMALLLGVALCSGYAASGLRYLQLVRLAAIAMRSVRRLREQVYRHVLGLPLAYFDRAITGQLISRVTNDTEAAKTLYVQVLFVLLDSSIVLTGALGAMAWLDWSLMLIVLPLFPAVLAIVYGYQRLSAPAVSRTRELRSDINARMAESIAGMSVLQASNAETRFAEQFAATNRDHYRSRRVELAANAWLLRPALDLLNVLLLAGVLYRFGLRHLSGLEIGVLYAFVSYIARVVEPLIQITMQFGQLQQAIIASARLNTLLQEPSAPAPSAAATIGAGRISLSGLGFAYHAGPAVLNGIDLEIPAGGFVGIVGHTGSGKSTLLSLLLRFYSPQSGHIEFDGVDINAIAETAFRRDVGLVAQEPFLLSASVLENIDMGRGLARETIERAARAAGLDEVVAALPEGYATELGADGARLSGGQRQLLAFARALAGEPRILLLDEATSHIDTETEQKVQLALAALHGKVTLVAIAHRLATIRSADTIIVLKRGRIVERGTHEQLLALEGGVYQRLYQLQQLEEPLASR
ncbi:ABC transporter ATP-binding protein [Paludibacterium yongneupense]|uniref:ABC transporter ATP-binding protein n=1 Tax=Paludibacterium yongneupense TaxID=400061 RepID=UPI0004130219|nr:ABC transporter transmembrane domain-containing protein [Paludibacterium yongneupense]